MPSTETVARSWTRIRPPYLEPTDLAFLDDVLKRCVEELQRTGMLHPGDPEFATMRQKLAAILVSLANSGDRDADSLERSALRLMGPYPGTRRTV